jgi:catechol 2,3-dioxygenase-like lactoylglutathione lyase family enzyme
METNDKNIIQPNISIRFIYSFCNDVRSIRHFYTDLIGLKEVSFKDTDEWGWVVYQSEGFQFMFFRAENQIPIIKDWTLQPGYEGGTRAGISWSILIPEEFFPETVKRLIDDGVKNLKGKPEWCQDSYWGFAVMDPMGNTCEIYCEPKTRPQTTEWSD